MAIPKHIRDAVRAKLLADLDQFFGECELFESAIRQERTPPNVLLTKFVQWHGGNERMRPERDATTAEINEAVKAYAEGVLAPDIPPYRMRAFDGKQDAEQVQMALALKGLRARTTTIIEAALRQKLC